MQRKRFSSGRIGFVSAVGTALPLLLLGLVSREALTRWRGRLLATGTRGKTVLGLVLVATSALILTGYDKPVEAALLRFAPERLTDFATQF